MGVVPCLAHSLGTHPASPRQSRWQRKAGGRAEDQTGVRQWWGRLLMPLPPFQIWQGIDIETKMHIRFLNMETIALCH